MTVPIPITIFVALSIASDASAQKSVYDSSADRLLLFVETTPTFSAQLPTILAYNPGFPMSFRLLTVRAAASGGTFWENATAKASTAVASTRPISTAFYIGADPSSVRNIAADYAEILIYGADLSGAARQKVWSYLARKWGVPL